MDNPDQSTYTPQPLDTSAITLPPALKELLELLAQHQHDTWAKQRIADGWRWGPQRNDHNKTHPCLVAYDELPESEKVYDRNAAEEALRAILCLGYTLNPPANSG